MKIYLSLLVTLLLLGLSGCQSNDQSNEKELARDAQLERADLLTDTVNEQSPTINTQPSGAKLAEQQLDPDEDCAKLSQPQCMNSKRCILDQNSKRAYFCRSAVDNCELGFVQAGEKLKRSCLNKGKCYYQGASCFCPQGVVCICGGGKPAMCSASKIDDHPQF